MKRWMTAILAGMMILSLAGCEDAPNVLDLTGPSANGNSAEPLPEGRDYGEVFTLSQDETAETAFFTYKVNSAYLAYELGEYIPNDESRMFLVVNVTVTNTFADDASIPMFCDDFTLGWEVLEDSTVYPEESFTDAQLPDEYDLFKSESRTGDVVFVVPNDVTTFELVYTEWWEDEFEGNSYRVSLEAGVQPGAL